MKTLKKSAYVIVKCSKYCVTASTRKHNCCHVTTIQVNVASATLHLHCMSDCDVICMLACGL